MKPLSGCCFIIPSDLLYQIIKEGSSEQKDKALRTLEVSESLRTQRSILAGMRGGPLRVAGHHQNRPIVYDAKQSYDIFSLPGDPKVYEKDTEETGDKDVDSCFHNTGIVYDFYKEAFMRNSIDDSGMAMHSSVHFGVDFDNAVWTGNQMVYGDGSDMFLKKGSVASNLTVTAHELAHGVTDNEANLVYRGQPGALNEHMSDVFAVMCDQWFNKHTVDQSLWLIGKDMLVEGQALRSLKEPGTAYPSDKQISHMENYHTGMRIHYSSGYLTKHFMPHVKRLEIIVIHGKQLEKSGISH
ncbi:MAG TPA: M4 family metallopeptidase [Nitrososphaeraceae archaeon]|nr:M4 family metallopeptidase [Nitrososphaeraceae archaeon]